MKRQSYFIASLPHLSGSWPALVHALTTFVKLESEAVMIANTPLNDT